MKRNAAFIIVLLIGILLIACQGEPKPAPLSYGESAMEQTIGEASPTPALTQNTEEPNITPKQTSAPENELGSSGIPELAFVDQSGNRKT